MKKMSERIIKATEPEYTKLLLVANLLTMYSPHDARYTVQNVYLDFGQDWMWSTIVRRGYRECQILSPRDWKRIVGSESVEELLDVIRDLINDSYALDYGKEKY